MIYYSIYKKDSGQIVLRGTAQFIEDVSKLIDDTTNVIYEQSKDNSFVENGIIIDMPEKPSDDYIFDYTSKNWIKNIEGIKTKVLLFRDQLLKDGPDRISPLWWSTMTEQEQQSWTKYRQDLLDITTQQGYPESIIWPTKP